MPDLLFLVHGMGLHQPNWHEPMVAALKEQYERYPALAARPFDQRFKVVPVTYDDRLRSIVTGWQNDATAVGRAASEVDARVVQDLTGWLRQAGDLTRYEWTHAADVMLWRIYSSVHAAIETHVGRQIVDALEARQAGESWSVIGYSLGTSVAHDALHALWTDTIPDGSGTGFAADQERALVIAQIANVSRVLQTRPPVYQSAVKPGPASQKRGCRFFLTARHKLDPFTTPASFDPVAWPDANAEKRGIFVRARIDHLHQWNVHAFEHYLAHPDVHIPLFRMLLDDRQHDFITDQDESEAKGSFEPFGPLEKKAAMEIKSWLDDRLPPGSATWESLSSIWDWFQLGRQLFG
jgi:hypothetical protein